MRDDEYQGDVKYRLWHPAHFWASDDEKIDDGDCGTERYVELDWAIKRWPEFEKELKLEAEEFAAELFGVGGVRHWHYSGLGCGSIPRRY